MALTHVMKTLSSPPVCIICVAFVTVIPSFLPPTVRGLSNSSFFHHNVYDLTRLAISDIKLARKLEGQTRLAGPNVKVAADQPDSDTSELLEPYLDDFKDGNGLEAVDQVELKSMLANPISIYRLIRRSYFYMRDIIETLNVTDIFDFHKATEEADYLHAEKDLPDLIPEKKDFFDAVTAILAVQSMYNFNVTEFADGNIRGLITKAKLGGIHCAEIGTAAQKRGMFVAAIEWFEEARRHAVEDETISVDVVNEKIAAIVKEHDQVWQKEVSNSNLGYGNVNIYLKPLKSVPAEQIIKVRDQLYNQVKGVNFSNVEVNSWGLCAGENIQRPKLKSRLFCWYEFHIHPIYRVGPLKMEFLSRQPDVFQVHNAFFEADMREMRVTPGKFLFGERDRQYYLPGRVDSKMAKKLGYMMGLDVPEKRYDSVHMVRVSYSPGCHFHGRLGVTNGLLHLDEVRPDPYEYFASVLVYLNKAEQGGNTGFPILLTYAEPIPGSAVFYFNVLSDGTPDRFTLHFPCPVSLGQKWIMVQRFSFADQFSKKPCPRWPKAWFELPVNGQFLPIPEELKKTLDEQEERALKELYPGLNELFSKQSELRDTGPRKVPT